MYLLNLKDMENVQLSLLGDSENILTVLRPGLADIF